MTTARGRLERDSQGLALVIERQFAAPIEQLWAMLTAPPQLAQWFGSYTGTPTVGSTIALSMVEDSSEVEHVTVLGCNAPRHFIGEFGRAGVALRVSFDLESIDSGTRMTLRQYLRPGDDLGVYGPGWEFHLGRLGAMVSGIPSPDWDSVFDDLTDPYRAVQAAHENHRG